MKKETINDLAIIIKWAFDHDLAIEVRPQINKSGPFAASPNCDIRDFPQITFRHYGRDMKAQAVRGLDFERLIEQVKHDAKYIAMELLIEDLPFKQKPGKGK